MSAIIKNALADAAKLYFLMIMAGLTTIAILFIITMAVIRFGADDGSTLVSKLGTKQDLLQWHQQEAAKLKKDLQQK